jgi:phospholipase C
VRGISWKVYSSPDSNLSGILADNVLSYFQNFQDPASPLHQNAFGPQFPGDFLADVSSGNLPQVSWLLPSLIVSDHPPAPPLFGEGTLAIILAALTDNPAPGAKTALFVAYDENGGFFDHVPPVTAPSGTPGEYVTAPAVPDPTQVGNPSILGPIGLGFRVPMLVISPFSRGGFLSSDLFDHTSILRFLEARFGAEVPNLSASRRATVGDLTSSFSFAVPDHSVPKLASTAPGIPEIFQQCAANLAGTASYPVPNPKTCRRKKLAHGIAQVVAAESFAESHLPLQSAVEGNSGLCIARALVGDKRCTWWFGTIRSRLQISSAVPV